MIKYFSRVFKGKRALENILKANHLILNTTKLKASFLKNEFQVSPIALRFTRAELMERLLPILNESLNESFNNIKLNGDKITIQKKNFSLMKNVKLTLADFTNEATKFNPHDILGETNAISLCGTTGTGKTELAKCIIEYLHPREIRIFTTKLEDFEGYEYVNDYSDENIEFIEKMLTGWLNASKEDKQRIKTVLVFDEAFILFSGKEKKTKALALIVNRVLAMNRAYGLRLFFITQTPNKEAMGELNTGLISTKLVNISDIQNYSSTFGSIPPQIKAQTLKTGEFYFFHRGEPVRILKYNQKNKTGK